MGSSTIASIECIPLKPFAGFSFFPCVASTLSDISSDLRSSHLIEARDFSIRLYAITALLIPISFLSTMHPDKSHDRNVPGAETDMHDRPAETNLDSAFHI